MPSNMVVWSHVRRYALDYASKTRYHTFSRASRDSLTSWLDAEVRRLLRERIDSLPSKGQTIK